MAGIKTHRRRRALAVVETAIVIPLLLLLLVGLLEYSWMFVRVHQVTAAARRGARLAVPPDALVADVQAGVEELMAAAGLSGAYTLSLSADPATLNKGDPLTVTVVLPYRDNHDIVRINQWAPVPANLRADVSMAKE